MKSQNFRRIVRYAAACDRRTVADFGTQLHDGEFVRGDAREERALVEPAGQDILTRVERIEPERLAGAVAQQHAFADRRAMPARNVSRIGQEGSLRIPVGLQHAIEVIGLRERVRNARHDRQADHERHEREQRARADAGRVRSAGLMDQDTGCDRQEDRRILQHIIGRALEAGQQCAADERGDAVDRQHQSITAEEPPRKPEDQHDRSRKDRQKSQRMQLHAPPGEDAGLQDVAQKVAAGAEHGQSPEADGETRTGGQPERQPAPGADGEIERDGDRDRHQIVLGEACQHDQDGRRQQTCAAGRPREVDHEAGQHDGFRQGLRVVHRDPIGRRQVAKPERACAGEERSGPIGAEPRGGHGGEPADRSEGEERDQAAAQQEITDHAIERAHHQERDRRIIVHPPQIVVVDHRAGKEALRVVDVPAFVVVSFEDKRNGNQVRQDEEQGARQHEDGERPQGAAAEQRSRHRRSILAVGIAHCPTLRVAAGDPR